jgi:hypothetical protein
MSLNFNDPERPPAYGEHNSDVWEPIILILADTTIHAESIDSAPLYRLSRAVAVITKATKEVEFERVERSVRTESDEPVVKPRSRHIYDLQYKSRLNGWDAPNVFIQSVSRRTLGHFGVKRSRLSAKKGLKVLPIDMSGKTNGVRGLPLFNKEAKPLFQIQPTGDRKSEWTDGDGNAIAVEDWSEDQHKLIITASLHRDTIDALVALWCARIWQYSDEHTERIHEGMEGGKF